MLHNHDLFLQYPVGMKAPFSVLLLSGLTIPAWTESNDRKVVPIEDRKFISSEGQLALDSVGIGVSSRFFFRKWVHKIVAPGISYAALWAVCETQRESATLNGWRGGARIRSEPLHSAAFREQLIQKSVMRPTPKYTKP
jgi:hypothetical protein